MAKRLRVGTCAVLVLGLLSLALLADEPAVPSPEQAVSEDLLSQALKSAVKGDATVYTERLEEALSVLPNEKLTNWLLGQVLVDGKWQPIEKLQQAAAADPRVKEYRWKRDSLDGTPHSELELARWCVANDRPDAARLHFARVLASEKASDGDRGEARKALDLKLVNGQYYTSAEIEELEAQAKDRKQAFETWRPKLLAWRKASGSKSAKHRDQALQELREVDDPKAILALEASLYDSSDEFTAELIKRLGKFPQFEATQALVRFALLTQAQPLAQAAVLQLKGRPIHDYYPQLLPLLQAPIQSRFNIVRDAAGAVRYEHVVGQEGPQKNAVAVRDTVYNPFYNVRSRRGLNLGVSSALDSHGEVFSPFTVENELAELASFLTALSLQSKVAVANTSIMLTNERVFYILENTSPQPIARNPAAWWDWWKQYQEKWSPTPTQYAYQCQRINYWQSSPATDMVNPSCFVAGTPVWTESGRQPIESLKPGDRVLSCNVDSGEVTFSLVLDKTLRPPWPVVRLEIGESEEEIVATKGHPFWVNGKGWKMAKELAAGDVLHTLHGPAKVSAAVALGAPREAHNLVVEGSNTYFVGDTAALVHDNIYWSPTTASIPGMVAK